MKQNRRNFLKHASASTIGIAFPYALLHAEANNCDYYEIIKNPDKCWVPSDKKEASQLGFVCSFNPEEIRQKMDIISGRRRCPSARIAYRDYGSGVDKLMRQLIHYLGQNQNRFVLSENLGTNNAMAYACRKNSGEIVKAVEWDPRFLNYKARESGTPVGAVAILAHEIAHHVNGDTDQDHDLGSVTRKEQELHADYWAGVTLAKIGYRENETVAVFATLGSGGNTHPPAQLRVRAARAGWWSHAKGGGAWNNIRRGFGFR